MKQRFTVHDMTNVLLIVLAFEFGIFLLRPVPPSTPPMTTAGPSTVVIQKEGKLQLWRLRIDTSDPQRRMKLCLEDEAPVP